jgi:hypothetical protein
MSLEPGVGAAFQATLLDNGNPIDLPDSSSWSWSTDDPTDEITQGGGDGSTVKVVISDPPASGRTTVDITATTTDPAGNEVSGSVTEDIIPGVEHTYTVNVSQIFASPRRR